jgi:hypothetical protein
MTNFWVINGLTIAAVFLLLALIKWASNKLLVALLLSTQLTVALLWLFYMNFGVINLYIFCVTFFFDGVFISLGLWAHARAKKSREGSDGAWSPRDDWLVVLTLVGFFFNYAAPVVGWGLTDLADEKSWPALYVTRFICAVILPTISGIFLLLFLFRRAPLFYVPVVLLLVALPVLTGWNAAHDLYDGPRLQIIRHGCYSDADVWASVESCFCNGKEVSCDAARQDEEVLLLPHTRRVLREEKSGILAAPGERVELQIGTEGFPGQLLRGELRAKTHPKR